MPSFELLMSIPIMNKHVQDGLLGRSWLNDIIIREKDCLTPHSFIIDDLQILDSGYERILGRLINKPIYDPKTNKLIAEVNTQITPKLVRTFKQKKIVLHLPDLT